MIHRADDDDSEFPTLISLAEAATRRRTVFLFIPIL